MGFSRFPVINLRPLIALLPKGRHPEIQTHPLNPVILIAVKDYLKATENGTDPAHPLFQTLGKRSPLSGRGPTHKSVDCLIKSVVQKALIQKRVDPHVMRYTFATTLLDNGNDLKAVQSLMGHSHIRTTERYLHSTDDRRVEAIRSLQFGG
jgi:site-specific recombinase XerD